MTKTQTPRRVYAVHHAGTGTTRLVRAVNVAAAVRHVVRTDYTAEVASQDDLIDLLSVGTRVEDAGADDLGDPPVKVLRFTATATVAEPPPERDPRVPDMFGDAPGDLVSPAMDAAWAAAEVVDAEWMAAPAVCDPVQVEGAGKSADLPAEFLSYIEGEGPAAEQPGEPVGCLGAAPTAVEPAGASLEGFDLQVQQVLDRRVQCNASGQAGEDAENIRSELKRQAEAATARAGGKIVAKFRDPATGQTWSGRGLRPRWLMLAIEAGKTPGDFLITTA